MTEGSAERRPPRPPRAALGYIVLVAVAFGVVTAVGLLHLPLAADARQLVLALAAGGAMTALFASSLRRHWSQPDGPYNDFTSIWVLPALLLAPAPYAGLLAVGLHLLLQALILRQSLERQVFNACSFGLSAQVASFGAAVAVGGFPGAVPLDVAPLDSARGAVALAVVLVLSHVTQSLLIAGVMTLSGIRITPWRALIITSDWIGELGEWGLAVLLTGAWTVQPVLVVAGMPLVLLTQRSLVHQQLHRRASTDAKTGLPSAVVWRSSAEAALRRATRAGQPCAVLVVDLDHFKQVNDSHGHLVGDDLLVGVARALVGSVRPGDLLGRFGGDEFVAFLPGADLAVATAVGERIRVATAAVRPTEPPALAGLHMTVSVGAAAGVGVPLDALLDDADQALLAGKRAGRDRVTSTPTTTPPSPTGSAVAPLPAPAAEAGAPAGR